MKTDESFAMFVLNHILVAVAQPHQWLRPLVVHIRSGRFLFSRVAEWIKILCVATIGSSVQAVRTMSQQTSSHNRGERPLESVCEPPVIRFCGVC